jgi:Pentapeptide repeats (9 copies)
LNRLTSGRLWARDRCEGGSRRSYRLLTTRAIAVAAAIVSIATMAAIGVLVWPFPLIPSTSPTDRLDALRTALAVGAGAAGVATIMLAARRQVHQERVAAATESDASERRTTELYAKSVEQLGSDKSAVRLGGLYALERLAQTAPNQRQTVVNVICAYLRMPYLPPTGIDEPATGPAQPEPKPGWGTMPGVIDTWATIAEIQRRASAESGPRGGDGESILAEWQVRVAAQTILASHLRRPRRPHGSNKAREAQESFWLDMDIDLSGAVLFDFDFRHCTARSAMFRACRFFGVARFLHAEFVREAQFDGAEFFGAAWFEAAKFGNDAWFGGARFSTVADFRRATFERRTAFGRNSWLGPAEFSGRVNFSETSFDRPPELSGVRAAETAAASGIQQWPVGWSTVAHTEDAQWLVVEPGDAS